MLARHQEPASAIPDSQQRFLAHIIPQVEELVGQEGIELHRKVADYYTDITSELIGRNDFTFWTTGAYTMYGGWRLKVWYHPDSEKSDENLVLDVEWWDLSKCEPRVFSSDSDWQAALLSIFLLIPPEADAAIIH